MSKGRLCKATMALLLFTAVVFSSMAAWAGETDLCIDLMKEGPATAKPGDTIEYKFTVENCGSVALQSGAMVFDPLFGEGPIWGKDLVPGEVAYFYRGYTVTEYDCGELVNNATAQGAPLVGYPVVYDYASWTVYVDCEPHEQPGTGTPGYWKNHPGAWPVESIEVCTTEYPKADAIMYMSQPVAGDKTYTMFKALVAAKLNVLIGNDSDCIDDTIADADLWMCDYGPVGSGVPARSLAWYEGVQLYWTLDQYNNGFLCAPPR